VVNTLRRCVCTEQCCDPGLRYSGMDFSCRLYRQFIRFNHCCNQSLLFNHSRMRLIITLFWANLYTNVRLANSTWYYGDQRIYESICYRSWKITSLNVHSFILLYRFAQTFVHLIKYLK